MKAQRPLDTMKWVNWEKKEGWLLMIKSIRSSEWCVIQWLYLCLSLQSHYSIKKAGAALGFGSENVILLSTDERYSSRTPGDRVHTVTPRRSAVCWWTSASFQGESHSCRPGGQDHWRQTEGGCPAHSSLLSFLNSFFHLFLYFFRGFFSSFQCCLSFFLSLFHSRSLFIYTISFHVLSFLLSVSLSSPSPSVFVPL